MAQLIERALKDGRFAWHLRYRDPTGKDIRKRVPAKTKKEAELYLAKVLTEIAEGTYALSISRKRTKFFEIADDFLEYGKAHKRSWDKDERNIRKLKAFFGDLRCEKITRSFIERYIAARKQGKGDLGKKAKPATINRELACLKTIFMRAKREGKIANDPVAGFKLLPEDNVRNRVLTETEYQKLLFAAPKHFRPVLITAWETGMRRNEILYLKWSQTNLKEGIIKLSGEETKTGRSRQVPISPSLMATLEKLPKKNEWVFNYKGNHLRDIRTAFIRTRKQAGIEDFWFHDLRHCFVTRTRRKGVPDRVIMAITGHQTMECFKRYDTISVEDLQQAVGAGAEKSCHNVVTIAI